MKDGIINVKLSFFKNVVIVAQVLAQRSAEVADAIDWRINPHCLLRVVVAHGLLEVVGRGVARESFPSS